MSKGVGEMVRSRSVQVKASAGTEGARRATRSALPTARQVRRGPWRRRSAGAWAGSGTWCCLLLRRRIAWRRCRGQVGVEIYRLERLAGPGRGAVLSAALQARQGDLVAEALERVRFRHIGF